MVYSFSSASLGDCSIATKDRNTGKSFGNCDEVACNAYSRCDLGGTTNSLSVTKPLLGISKLEER